MLQKKGWKKLINGREVQYDYENDDLVEVDYNFCTCPEWDIDIYGPPFGNLCVGCGKPVKQEV